MYRILATLMVMIMIFLVPLDALAQAGRYRLQTSVSGQERLPSPSFRTGSQQDMMGQGQMPTMPGGSSSMSEMGSRMGEAAMMGAAYAVHVLGEVNNPGTYMLPASARVAQAVQMAGGLAENASERNIELRRGRGKTTRVDLLKFRQDGNLSNNPYLTDNDVVFVPLREKVVRVVGSVKRPELYELKNEDTLAAVISLAGGFSNAVAKSEPIRVVRFVDGEKQVDEIINAASAMSGYLLLSGDVVVVPSVITKGVEFDYNLETIPGDQVFYPSYEDRVFVLGGVAFPGAYPFSPYYTVSQYVTLAGGLNDRGREKYRITPIGGKSKRVGPDARVNPGDSVHVNQGWMSPAAWMGFALSIASFGLSASATIIALRR